MGFGDGRGGEGRGGEGRERRRQKGGGKGEVGRSSILKFKRRKRNVNNEKTCATGG